MEIIKFIFGGLFSNRVVLDGRKRAGWLAFLIFVVSMVLAVIPTFSSLSGVKGSNILASNTNGVDNGLCEFVDQLNVLGIDLVVEPKEVDGKTTYVLVNRTQEVWNSAFGDAEKPYEYKAYDGDIQNVRLKVFYLDKNLEETIKFKNTLTSKKFVATSEKEDEKEPITSFLLLGREMLYLVTYAKGVTDGAKATEEINGVYSKSMVNTNIKAFKTSPTAASSQVLEKWESFLDKGYEPIKANAMLVQISLYTMVNLVVVVMVGLMIFVTTRGKKNPFRDYTLLESFKIAAFAALCPAILTIIAGSFIPAYSTMIFMLTLGMRIMWLTSKHLKPIPAH